MFLTFLYVYGWHAMQTYLFIMIGNVGASVYGAGGGMAIVETNIINITDTNFTFNSAFLGGAIAMLNGTLSYFSGSTKFANNKASVGAGTFFIFYLVF